MYIANITYNYNIKIIGILKTNTFITKHILS